MSLTLGFYGGAGTVTGSRFLLQSNSGQLLIDCGLFQGLKELRLRNWDRPSFDPRAVDAVVLTHAHIDHSGWLPRLVRQGFRGPIYCTPATRDLARILLVDAARLQEEDAEYANRKGYSKHHPALPLFTEKDAQAALRQMQIVAHEVWFEPVGQRVRFLNAGHILGSAFAEVQAPAQEGSTSLVFSGDVGRYGAPLHPDPKPLPATDTLIMESTYGDRLHNPTPLAAQIAGPFRQTLERGGIVLIPAFAVARAQIVTLMLRQLMEDGELPTVPVHIDSPMAVDVTEIYGRYLGTHEVDAGVGDGRRLFPRSVTYHRTVEESKQLNDLKGPRIIVSSSGMLTGGRVLHHLRRLLPDPKNLLVLVGYQAAGTRGRALQDGARTLKMHGEFIPVRAKFISLDVLSAHADREELLRWLHSAPSLPGTTFLTHGEPESTRALAQRLRGEGLRVLTPTLGQKYAFDQVSGAWTRDS
jgi:metallo-beta-lactamase family protein